MDGSTQPHRYCREEGRWAKDIKENCFMFHIYSDGVVGDIGAGRGKKWALVLRDSGMVVPASILFFLFCLQDWI